MHATRKARPARRGSAQLLISIGVLYTCNRKVEMLVVDYLSVKPF